ncbi:MAG: hypothetical protein O2960_28055, partial [Verrucomicrobia bacterium]|nr:hypothetical protein [Verrucomicrobiota bacterium]
DFFHKIPDWRFRDSNALVLGLAARHSQKSPPTRTFAKQLGAITISCQFQVVHYDRSAIEFAGIKYKSISIII